MSLVLLQNRLSFALWFLKISESITAVVAQKYWYSSQFTATLPFNFRATCEIRSCTTSQWWKLICIDFIYLYGSAAFFTYFTFLTWTMSVVYTYNSIQRDPLMQFLLRYLTIGASCYKAFGLRPTCWHFWLQTNTSIGRPIRYMYETRVCWWHAPERP